MLPYYKKFNVWNMQYCNYRILCLIVLLCSLALIYSPGEWIYKTGTIGVNLRGLINIKPTSCWNQMGCKYIKMSDEQKCVLYISQVCLLNRGKALLPIMQDFSWEKLLKYTAHHGKDGLLIYGAKEDMTLTSFRCAVASLDLFYEMDSVIRSLYHGLHIWGFIVASAPYSSSEDRRVLASGNAQTYTTSKGKVVSVLN
jgi:hypothetical protein